MRYNLPDVPRTTRCGRAPAPVSLSATQVKAKGLLTSGTFGPRGTISSASADLQWFWVNKLMQRFGTAGSTLFSMTWKERDTPAGRSLFRLQASGRRTKDSGFIGWVPCPTPTACDHKGSGRPRLGRGPSNNLRDWFRLHYGFLYPPVRVVEWLMGFPPEWGRCALMAMPSSRRSRRK